MPLQTVTTIDILRVARGELGYEETGGSSGHNGNHTKYWAELDPGLQGQPWCACFQRWVDRHAGGPDLPVSNPYYCPTLVTYAKQHSLWDTSGHYSPGDMVFFDFTGHGIAEHIGRVVSDDGHSIHTIEGNTLPDSGGNQADGGGVYAKLRAHGPTILGALTYHNLLAHTATHGGKPPRNAVKKNPFGTPKHRVVFGDKGDDVRFVQWATGVPVDGTFNKQTAHGVALFQQNHHKCGPISGIATVATIDVLTHVTH